MGCNDTAKDKWYTPRSAETWDDLLQMYAEYNEPVSDDRRWVFRGDRPGIPLETKLRRAFQDYEVRYDKREAHELETVRAFQRKAALYLEHEPDKDDILEWLAVMRHHGAPARLVDFTYSFYLAVYLALAENPKGVVWVLNAARFNKPQFVKDKIWARGDGQEFDEIRERLGPAEDLLGIRIAGDKIEDLAITHYLMKNPVPLVYAVNPFKLNKRLTMQQGLFLLAGDPKATFRENLDGCFDSEEELRENAHMISLEVSVRERNRILFELKKMNISNEVLFPGLDGFAKSLGERFAYPETFPPTA